MHQHAKNFPVRNLKEVEMLLSGPENNLELFAELTWKLFPRLVNYQQGLSSFDIAHDPQNGEAFLTKSLFSFHPAT